MISLWKAASRGRRAFLCAFGIDIPDPLRYNRINKNLGGQNSMNFLEERIVKDGVVKAGNIYDTEHDTITLRRSVRVLFRAATFAFYLLRLHSRHLSKIFWNFT